MADVIQSNFTHTYAGAEVIDVLFYQPEEANPSLAEMYQFKEIKGDKANIYLPQKLRKVLKKYTTCGWAVAGSTANINDKTITVEKIKANLEECVDQWDDTIFAELMKTGVSRDDISGTLIDSVIKRQVVNGVKSDIHRIVWFAENGDADTDWDMFDGWLTLINDNSASIGTDCFIDMDGTAFETGDALASDGAIGLLRQIWDNQNEVLAGMPTQDRKFYVTRTVYNNYLTTLESQSNTVGQLLITDGVSRLFFRGVELIVVPEWDVNLADTTNPHHLNAASMQIGSNLIVYTTKDNLVFGSDVRAGETEFKTRYATDDDETMKITQKFKLGAQIIHYELICVAF
jgi:hypothetical protein